MIIAVFPVFPVTFGESETRKRWAVIASCSDRPPASNDTQYMHHVLSEHCGFDDIYYLDIRTDLAGVNAFANKSNFRWSITTWLHDHSDADDLIFIFCIGHGGGYNTIDGEMEGGRIDGSEGDRVDEGAEHFINGSWVGVDECIFFTYNLSYEQYWDDELADDLDTLTYSKLIFVRVGCAGVSGEDNGGCFNGGLIDDISATNRIIMTASNETWYCYTDCDGDGFSEWSEAFMDALHGEDTYWNEATKTVVHTGISINADSNGNGYVSLWEAWEYAWNHDDARWAVGHHTDDYGDPVDETPWFDDDGDGLPTFLGDSDHFDEDGQGDLAEQTYLNRQPSVPSTPTGPTCGYKNVWYIYSTNTTDPDEDNICYQFEFMGPCTNMSFTTGWYVSGQTASIGVLWETSDPLGTYHIRVRAQDVYGWWSDWSSSLAVTIINRAPNIPSQPSGPTSVYAGAAYTYSTNTTDPDGDDLYYLFNWGDNSTTSVGPAASGATVSASHSWNSTGIYGVKVKAYDGWLLTSWSPILTVNGTSPSHGGCPTLFVWNGTAYVDYGVIDIHNPTGEDVIREVPILKEDVGISNYRTVFRLREGWIGLNFSESVIDQVKLYAVDRYGNRHLCPLISATHSRLGNILLKLLASDDYRVQTLLLETIDLTFSIPYQNIQSFTFIIEGCNIYKVM